MNGVSIPGNHVPAYIESLCDVVANKKRDQKDFQLLNHCLEHMTKECTPFKGKILQHLQIHALGNPNVNLKLLACCFARATLLFRKTPNKSEGPLGGWKSGLLGELINLEDNLDQLYESAGINTSKIIGKSDSSSNEIDEQKSQEKTDFEAIINEHLLKVNWSANIICALICVQSDFELPIPVNVLLRLAAKIGLLRWKDYKKRPNGLIRNHVYTLTPYLININLMLFKAMINVLGSNIIPFMPFINQTTLRIIEWTRSSNLLEHDENLYHSLRSQLLKKVSFIAEQLSLNMNLDPSSLKALLEVELVDNLEKLVLFNSSSSSLSRDKHMVDALSCLENLIVIYSGYLDAPLESKVKSYVIQTCIKIYRDFESNSVSLVCRRQLLHLLQTIANQPYATSTTEVAHHIFELAEKLEIDPEIRALARRSLRVGLAHRPTIVAHHDVYNCYGLPMLAVGDELAVVEPEAGDDLAAKEVEDSLVIKEAEDSLIIKEAEDSLVIKEAEDGLTAKEVEDSLVTKRAEDSRTAKEVEDGLTAMEVGDGLAAKAVENGITDKGEENGLAAKATVNEPETQLVANREEDEKVNSYMNYFVEKLA